MIGDLQHVSSYKCVRVVEIDILSPLLSVESADNVSDPLLVHKLLSNIVTLRTMFTFNVYIKGYPVTIKVSLICVKQIYVVRSFTP